MAPCLLLNCDANVAIFFLPPNLFNKKSHKNFTPQPQPATNTLQSKHLNNKKKITFWEAFFIRKRTPHTNNGDLQKQKKIIPPQFSP